MHQKSKDQYWTDESGMKVQQSRLTKLEKKKEQTAHKILKASKSLQEKLVKHKETIIELCDDVYKLAEVELSMRPNSKGNFTYFSFDHTVKIEVSVSERIEFDDLHIQAAKEKLDEFIEKKVDSKDEFFIGVVKDAFSTSRGKLDSKKVMSMFKHSHRTKEPLFHEALALVKKSIRRPESKRYFRVWEKDAEGKYQNIDLNFSSL